MEQSRKVFQHESGTDKYIFVPSDDNRPSYWRIGTTLGKIPHEISPRILMDDYGKMSSRSAGTTCPGSPEAPINREFGRDEWWWEGAQERGTKISVRRV